ncbi:molybdopterin molybdotransferase MoeA [Listeria innocua]|uniref:molybdopterin molybdotransferase MoeA n=1 Tax=Listeria innocua TaxID=1642 RepID=UPI0001EBB663|nr:molybdopterin molybdotransferase MoeA [Listeria innocua]EFR94312.1 molybdopterin biosynthesis protein MoeA [Listeria innocua FSL J1-023]OET31080.1 molybdopterin molybdenumtransferase MoeA [Listeria monocytogenes]UVD66723.1 molybdopterin molybdotransferase MoeA [Listeria innocua]HAA0650418.1 molybdopterin molybdenumtransferase MoeA [Listeria innocua]
MIEKRNTIRMEQAREVLCNQITHLPVERKNVTEALNQVLQEPIFAPFPAPYFRRSGYDGFAITEEDDGNYPITLHVVAEVPCGKTYDKPLKPGETVRIMTGAKVPDNASKIIMLEQSREAENKNDIVLINTQKSSNITEIGAEFAQGDLLLDRGHTLNAGSISLLSSFGISEVQVIRKPKVAILSTGSELVPAGNSLPDGKIYNSNQPLLENLLTVHHAEICAAEQLPDNYEDTKARLLELTEMADLIVTTGGVSVGDYDFMADIAKQEAELLFNKIQMRPGSPTTGMWLNKTLVIALSGNPGACFTGFYLLVEPVLATFMGKDNTATTKVRAKMASDYTKNNGFDRFLRGTYHLSEEGDYLVELVGSDMSSALGNLHLTTCLFKIPGGKVGKYQGEEVEAWLLSSK